LLNAGDFIEFQVLTAGYATQVVIGGRISDVIPQRRAALPYPPGSGREGEMLGFDKFMWWVPPYLIAALFIGVVAASPNGAAVKASWLAVIAVIFGVLYPMRVRYLVKRRRAWRP
jgi:hypothetical protein